MHSASNFQLFLRKFGLLKSVDLKTIEILWFSSEVENIKSRFKDIYHFSVVTYYRIFITSLFPEYEKIVYLKNIVHYALYKKPWQYDDVIDGGYFWSYAKNSPFYDRILENKNGFGKEDEAEKRSYGERNSGARFKNR